MTLSDYDKTIYHTHCTFSLCYRQRKLCLYSSLWGTFQGCLSSTKGINNFRSLIFVVFGATFPFVLEHTLLVIGISKYLCASIAALIIITQSKEADFVFEQIQ